MYTDDYFNTPSEPDLRPDTYLFDKDKQGWFDSHPHEWVRHPRAGYDWGVSDCARCGLHSMYHYSKRQRIFHIAKSVFFIVVLISALAGALYCFNKIYDPPPRISEHQKCINDDGTWVRSERYYSYCILDGRVK